MIYVDVIIHYPDCKLPYKYWCHMATDGDITELHHMAARLGLRRSWFQVSRSGRFPHYDLTPRKRALAVRLGAVEIESVVLVRRCWSQNEQW